MRRFSYNGIKPEISGEAFVLEKGMTFRIFSGLLLPFFGTLLGCACVLFMKNCMSERVRSTLLGFAGGIMVAASVWSLLLPAMDYSSDMGALAFLPATVGFLLGVAFLIILEWVIPRFANGSLEKKWSGTAKLIFAVGLHNIPEGMAVGAVFAGLWAGNTGVTLAGAFGLAAGIAIQNVPEGAIVSMPLKAEGKGKGRAFLAGVISGVVEPIGALLTLYAVSLIMPIIPYLLGFAAGAMVYVVVNDLVPEMALSVHSRIGAFAFALGFVLMMTLDIVLG
jgi:ZIP family zinc transporter